MIDNISFYLVILESGCDEEDEGADLIQKEHCQKLAYIVEGNTISPRCSTNCACCKSGAKTKTSNMIFLLEAWKDVHNTDIIHSTQGLKAISQFFPK